MMYTVTVKPVSETEPGAFAMLHRYDKDAVVEFSNINDNGNETWTIETERDIDGYLDNQPGVITYEHD